MYPNQGGHSRSGTMGAGDTASDMSNMLRKYKIVILGEQSSKQTNHKVFGFLKHYYLFLHMYYFSR